MIGNLDRNEEHTNLASQARMKRKLIIQEKRNVRSFENHNNQYDNKSNDMFVSRSNMFTQPSHLQQSSQNRMSAIQILFPNVNLFKKFSQVQQKDKHNNHTPNMSDHVLTSMSLHLQGQYCSL
ncbi:unnamed protein product [Lupinus luteus]|uniref:Uncharacterized protein n=1 Tax=Lupinus luteus TaxID=3873 RepID=A0AAV1VQZ2_LUPLU